MTNSTQREVSVIAAGDLKPSAQQVTAARRVTAGRANDAAHLREVLAVLGLLEPLVCAECRNECEPHVFSEYRCRACHRFADLRQKGIRRRG